MLLSLPFYYNFIVNDPLPLPFHYPQSFGMVLSTSSSQPSGFPRIPSKDSVFLRNPGKVLGFQRYVTAYRKFRFSATPENSVVSTENNKDEQRQDTDIDTLVRRFFKVAVPYWSSEDKIQARLRLASVFALTLATTGISVGFNFLGRDFYNSLANKDQEQFTKQLLYYLGAFAGGIPIFVLRDYAKDVLALRWRSWMTTYYMDRYFKNQMFYKIQSQSIVDNPDQRIVDDLSAFAGTTLAFSLTVFNAAVDLVSFSNILYGIYPPLFVVLLVYSLGGTAISILLGKRLVNLNFMQEKKEADFRYGLARIRENAESIAFYGGEGNEMKLLLERFRTAFENLSELLLCSRNLEFFTSGYRYLIQILPAAVVAPMYFSGKIEFGVINQSVSAFNHILSDVSLIVYQFQSISAFSAVIDRLGEFDDVLDDGGSSDLSDSNQEIKLLYDYLPHQSSFNSNGTLIVDDNGPLLIVQNLTLETPRNGRTLIHDLSLEIKSKDFLLVMGPSGCGKTSLLRSLAGLWTTGKGKIAFYTNTENGENLERSKYRRFNGIFFLPQKPYMVLGTLREQLLYPTWSEDPILNSENSNSPGSLLQMPNVEDTSKKPIRPTDDDLIQVLEDVRLGDIISRFNGLDSSCDWSSVLSLGEQQRLAFARLLLSKPTLVLLDESTSALDEQNEEHLYKLLKTSGITYVSIGHRKSLRNYHSRILQISRFHSGKKSDNGRNWHLELINPTGRSKPAEKLL